MHSTESYSAWLKWLWLALWLAVAAAMFVAAKPLQIDTNLADVTPTTINSAESADAIKALQSNIENRVLILLSSADELGLDRAEELLREALTGAPNLEVHPDNDEIFNTLQAQLSPFRFNFLTDSQRQDLIDFNAEQIAEQAKSQMLTLIGEPRILGFADDPLGWHSSALLNFLQQQTEEENSRLIGLSIARGAMDIRAQETLSQQLDSIFTSIKSATAVSIDTSGVFFFAADAAQAAKRDISLISSISTIGIVMLLWLTFGSLRALGLPLISVASGVVFAAVVTHLIFGSLHILTIVFGASLIGIAIDYALHYLVHQSGSKKRTIGSNLFGALALSLCTSVIGYAALGLAGLPALQKVAVFSCSGLLMAWITVVVLGKYFTLSDRSVSNALAWSAKRLSNALQTVSPKVWSLTVLVFALVGLYGSQQAENFNDDPRVFFNADPRLVESEQKVAAVATDFEPGRYVIVAGDSSEEVYSRVAAFTAAMRTKTQFKATDIRGIPLLLIDEAEQSQNYLAMDKLYSREGAATLLADNLGVDRNLVEPAMRAYENARDERLSPVQLQSLLNRFFPPSWFETEQGDVISFILIRKGLNADALSGVTAELPGVEYVNTLARTSAELQKQRSTGIAYLLIAIVLIAIILVIRYRSFSALFSLLIPIGSIAGFVSLCMVFGVGINLFHVMALFLVLGFGMDYAIFSREMTRHRNITMQAIVLSALTSLLSFGLLAMSEIPIVSSFGFTLLIGNLFNLIGAIILSNPQDTVQENHN